jgi:hypothetical protein
MGDYKLQAMVLTYRPLRGLNYSLVDSILGLAPQALCCRALRALLRHGLSVYFVFQQRNVDNGGAL